MVPLADPTVIVTLTPEAQEILEWARKKMLHEAELVKLADQYPIVKQLKDQLDTMVALVKDYD